MSQGHAKTNGAAVVLHVERVARESERFGEVIHDLGNMIERIRESFQVRPVALSKARIIRRDKTIAIGEPGQEWLEHSRRRREAVPREKRCRVFCTGLSNK